MAQKLNILLIENKVNAMAVDALVSTVAMLLT